MPSAAARKRPRRLRRPAPRTAARRAAAIAPPGRNAVAWGFRELWRKAGQGASESASERLAEADIDLDRRVGRTSPQRRRQVETHRPERRIIAQPEPRTIEYPPAGLRQRVAIIAAGVKKRH